MRCPKCGFISFDHLESCKKCKKNISEASAELDGTVFAVPAPVFLDLDYKEDKDQSEELEGAAIGEEAFDDAEESLDLSFADDETEESEEIVMNLDDDGGLEGFGADGEEIEGPVFELEDTEETGPEEEIAFDFAAEEESAEAEEGADDDLQLDFGDIDISDLAPPEEGGEEPASEALAFEEEPAGEAVFAGGPASVSAPVSGSGLEDLQVEDLDLETPAPLVAGSKAGGKLMPSVKTGTALDDFEIDLGELTSGDK